MVKVLDVANTVASRRNFLMGLGAVAGVGALAACSSKTVNGVTTVTINVAKIDAYGQAGINAVNTILGYAPIAALIPSDITTAIKTAEGLLSGALSAFDNAANGSLVVSYNDADWKTRVDSVLNDLKIVSDDLKAGVSSAVGKVSASLLNDAQTVLNALDTVISFFEAMIGYLGASKYVPKMSEAQALRVLHVTVK